ncbi:hypothetical protein NIES4075_10330 [Tolypothrix sp. NIES-4075]|nr:hypothetical protein NIES4075_10330 [Tolypothrix sp. NIES-4075]
MTQLYNKNSEPHIFPSPQIQRGMPEGGGEVIVLWAIQGWVKIYSSRVYLTLTLCL